MGKDVTGWVAADRPGEAPMEGRYARLDRLEADAHAGDLFTAFAGHDGLWDYMPYGPFHSAPAYHRWAKDATAGTDPVFWAIREAGAAHPVGVASYLRITPDHGVIEVGQYLPVACLAAQPGGDRGDFPDDGLGLCPRLSAL